MSDEEKTRTKAVSKTGTLKDRIFKNTKLDGASFIAKSEVFGTKTYTKSEIPLLNFVTSGSFNKGLYSGMTQIAGPSRHFKSLLGLLFVKAFLEEHKEGFIIFYDSEFGISLAAFDAMGIDMDRVIHIPVTNIEELKVDVTRQLAGLKREDKVLIFVDSIGNLASIKEVTDAEDDNVVVDMTRAKELKSFGRIITPHLSIKDIPMIIINHTYDTQEKYSKKIVSGGQGLLLSSDTVLVMGKRQDKKGDEIVGNKFVLNVEKSRYIREKTLYLLEVSYEDGVNPYSGLWDLAVEVGVIVQGNKGWYNVVGGVGKNFQRGTVENDPLFWAEIMENTNFKELVEDTYKLGSVKFINNVYEEDPFEVPVVEQDENTPIEEYDDLEVEE